MDEPELSYQDAMQDLADLFSVGPIPTKLPYRRYVLELIDGKPTFRRDVDEIELAVEDAINEASGPDHANDGNNIVPKKLAEQFPGRSV